MGKRKWKRKNDGKVTEGGLNCPAAYILKH